MFRLLPVECMPRLRVDDKARCSDASVQNVLIDSGAECILVTPQNQRWSIDRRQFAGEILLQKTGEHSLPNPSRNAEAFLNDSLEELVRHVLSESTLLECDDNFSVHGVFQCGYDGIPKLLYARIAPHCRERTCQHQPLRPLGVIEGKALRNVASHAMPCNHGCI